MSRYLVLKTLPKGQEPGETVELNDDEARVFLLVEAVQTIDAPPVEPSSDAAPRRRYGRRDLQAKD